MAKTRTKGTILKMYVATVMTAIAQIISIDGPEAEPETYDGTTLDTVGSGKEYPPTGYVEGGEVSGELFLDPVLAGHQAITDLITAPALTDFSITFADPAATVWPFEGTIGLGVAVDMADGLKASFKIKLSGIVAYPT